MTESPAPLKPRDVVLTPSGERARVLRVLDDELECRYLNALPGAVAEFSIRVSLVRVCVDGRPEPRPVRVAA